MKKYPYLPMIGVSFFVICWVAAACAMPSWHFMETWPSTLGTADSPYQILFNTGMIFSGILMAIYSYSIYSASESIWFRVAFIFSMVGGILLCGVGVFNDDIPFAHELFTMSMFTISMISVIYLGIFLYLTGRRAFGSLCIVCVAAISLSGLVIPLPAWDTIGTMFIDVISFATSFALWRYRFYETGVEVKS